MVVEPQPGPGSPDSGSSGPGSRPAQPQSRARGKRLLVGSIAVGALVAAGLWAGDRLARQTYLRLRPGLERQLGQILGHPLRLGPYQGLGLDGLRVGPSQLLAGPQEGSTAAVRGLRLGLDPLASLVRRQPWLLLELDGAQLDLRPNARGQVWVLGRPQRGARRPRLQLQLGLRQPAQLRLHPRPVAGTGPSGGRPAAPAVITGQLEARLQLQTLPGQLQLQSRLHLAADRPAADPSADPSAAESPSADRLKADRLKADRPTTDHPAGRRPRGGAGGGPPEAIGLNLTGAWDQRRWHGQLQLDRLALARLQRFLPLPGQLTGQASGQLAFRWQPGQPWCRGSLGVQQLRWQPGAPAPVSSARGPAAASPPASPLASALTADRLQLGCQGQQLTLPATRWRYGRWSGQLEASTRAVGEQRFRLTLEARPAPAAAPIRAELGGQWQWLERQLGLRDLRFTLRRGRSQLQASGQLAGRWTLRGSGRLDPRDLDLRPTPPAWLLRQPLQAEIRAEGPRRQPRWQLALGQSQNPLLGPWRAALQWQQGLLRLEELRSPHLTARGSLPLQLAGRRGLQSGELALNLQLRGYPLQRLNPLVGTQLAGRLDGEGWIAGPLQRLIPDLTLSLQQPQAGPLGLQETWTGRWRGAAGGGGSLRMEPLEGSVSGLLTARLDRRWVPVAIRLERGEGALELAGRPSGYRWRSQALPLAGLALALGPQRTPQPLQGQLSGSGTLDLQPLAFSGQVQLERPVFLGLRAQQLSLQGRYGERRYSASGSAVPQQGGRVALSWSGRWRGPFRSHIEGRELGADLFRQLVQAWPLWRGRPDAPLGRAADLGTLVLDTVGGSLQEQLEALARAQAQLAALRSREAPQSLERRLRDLQARVDLDLTLAGANLAGARADLELRGHLWLPEDGQDRPLTERPLVARLQGPLRQGSGSLSLGELPLALVALLTPVPASLRGQLALEGRYRLGGGPPALSLELALREAALGETALNLERGQVALQGDRLQLDLALRAAGATSSVDLAGSIPIDPAAEGLELRLASRGDGLRFLTPLAQPALRWQRGSADLQLLVRGSLRQPIANGFVRLRDGQLQFIGQAVRDLEAIVLFDFEQLFLQDLTASVGPRGRLSGSGSLGLWRPQPGDRGLALQLKEVPFKLRRIQAEADGALTVSGSLRSMAMGGELRISRGSVNVQPGQLASEEGGGRRPVSVPQLAEAKWTFDRPLVLLGPEVESSTGEALRASVPRFPFLGFDNLRLQLGPNLRVGVPNVATFSTGGSLLLSGRLDPSLRARGVVRLLGGRLNLFTTSFSLDPDAANVAVFTPSLGLLPYLDVALRTRVSDSLDAGRIGLAGLGTGSGAASQSYASQATLANQGGFSSLNQLNLVRITMSVSGPADRLAESIRLRSSPPLPEERLVALIGGNSLAGLSGAGAGAALATALGQSLLSPLVGGLSEAFGERLSFALYPTYVNPVLTKSADLRSGQVPPQLVLASEIGVDITERFNASVLAAPNRSDVPPQITLTYKASELINLQSTFDTQGAWQGQVQLFFRF